MLVIFVSETPNLFAFFCHLAILSFLAIPKLFHCISENLRSALNIFNIDSRLESSQMWIYLQKLVALADLRGKVGRD